MTREEAIKVLDEWVGTGRVEEDCFIHFEADLDDVETALDMAIAALREQPQWISVEERLPECDEKCLCRYTFGEKGRMYFYQVLDYYATDPQPHFQHAGNGSEMRVTHWMPLPEAPKED